MFRIICLVGFVFVLLGKSAWCSDESGPPRTGFQISHFHHPEMASFQQLIRNVYASVGIDVTFTELPAARGLLQLNNGTFDADVIRLAKSIENFDNMLLVSPALVEAEILLLCLKNTPCDTSVLSNDTLLIASNLGNQNTLAELKIDAAIVHDESNTHSIDMLRKGRVDYVIYGSNRHFREQLEQEFLVSVLRTETMYHVLHQKHADLLPQIEKALEEQLLLFDSSLR